MTRYFTFTNDTSNKFWQITTDDNAYTVTFGRIGTAGQSQTKTVDTPERCRQEADKLIREKTGKGYFESVDGVTVAAIVQPTPKPTQSDDQQVLETVLNRYDEIIQNTQTDQLLTFLQRVDKRHYPALEKAIKGAKKHWCDTVVLKQGDDELLARQYQYENQKWGNRGTQAQKTIINLSALALLSLPYANAFNIYWLIAGEQWHKYTHSILLWARPPWLTEYLITITKKERWNTLAYEQLRSLEQEGLINYRPELFANALAGWGQYNHRTGQQNDPQSYIDFLLSDLLVRNRDIPTLFDYPAPVHDTVYGVDESQGTIEHSQLWPQVFTRLLADGKLDRLWFFEKCISVQTKDWNINLRAFYRKQVEAGNPTSAELVSLQSALFPLLAAQHPHVVNWVVGLLKTIVAEPDFRPVELLEWAATVMMRDDCKTALKTLLAMLERLLKFQPDHRTTIAHLLVDVFVINDLPLQTKSAALLIKYGDSADNDLKNRLQSYSGQMLGTVVSNLRTFLVIETVDPPAKDGSMVYQYAPPRSVQRLVPEQEVCLPDTWNDLLFLFGQFISSDGPLDGEILMNALLLLPADTPADFREQLKPNEKQLQKMNTAGVTKHCFRDYLLHWLTGSSQPKFDITYPPAVLTLRLQLYRLQHLDRKRKSGSRLPLLSLPTHGPCWISPRTLVKRLLAYQQAGEAIESLDLAIAIARMSREDVAEALALSIELDVITRQLMHYCLGLTTDILLPRGISGSWLLSAFRTENTHANQQTLWAVAARTLDPDADFPEFAGTSFADVPNVQTPFVKDIVMKESWKVWKNPQTNQVERSPLWQELTIPFPSVKNPLPTLLYSNDLFAGNNSWPYNNLSLPDILFWHSLIPQQPEALFTIITKYGCFASEESPSAARALSLLLQPGFQFREMSLMVLACGLMAKKHETSALAAEVIIHHIGQQTIDAARLGDRLGWLLAGNYAPVQRLTDALNLVRDVSPLHNNALAITLDGLFAQLMVLIEPPKNTRKLLEIYLDLLVKLAEPPCQQTTLTLTNWQKSTSLRKTCTDILKLS